MKFLPLILVAIICGTTLAKETNCAALNQAQCNQNNECQYIISHKCVSKCSAYKTNDECIDDKNCKNGQICQPKFDQCSKADGKEEKDCTALNNTCDFVPAVRTCTVKQETIDECQALKGNCNKNTNCTYSLGQCWVRDDLCVYGTSCDEKVCTKTNTESKCRNFDCPTNITQCGDNCNVSNFECVSTPDDQQCPPFYDQATCTLPTKYCDYQDSSYCSSKSTFSNILAISSLNVLLALYIL